MNESEIKNKFKILLVDDETSIRVTLGEFLKDADYYVETAENVETAMRILSESKFDVVISDIIMPKISGMEFLIMIKDKYPDIQVILMTGEPTIKTVSIAVRERASDYLSKPVGKSDIIKAVSNAVKIKKINDERLLLLKENKNYQENLEQLVKEKTDSLEESEARFKAISESASDSIICINEEWEIIFINNATEHLFGVSRKNIIGKKFRVLIPDRYWNIKQDGLQYLLSDSVKNMIGNTIEIHGIRNGDFEFPIELSLSEWTINNKHYFSTIIRDITSRKKIQEKQKISEEKYRALYENSPLPYQSLNENGEFIDINPAWLRTLGYQRDEVIGFHFTEFLHPDYKNNFQNNFEIFKKNGIVHGVKYEIRHKEGHYLYISYEGRIGLSPDGKFRQTYCVFQDITSIYKAQKALEKSENKFREIIQGDVSGIVVYQAIDNGKNFIIQDFNPRAEEIEKISKEEVIGKKVTEAFPGVEVFGILNVFQEVWQTGIPQSHPLSLYEDDRIKGYRENYIYKLNTGEIVATYQDLTEKKQIENSLIASEELFRKAFYTSPDAVNINRLEDGMYISVNKGFTKISGYTEEEVIGKTSTELGIWFDNNDRLKLINGLKKDGTLTNLEYKFKLKNGKIIDCLMSATILNVDGDEHILSITKDITERKKAQKDLRESQRQLTTLMANLPGMAYRCKNDENWTMEILNEGSLELTGYTPNQLIGNSEIAYVDIIHKDDRQKVFDIINYQLILKQKFKLEYRIVTVDGIEKWVLEQGQGVLGKNGDVIAVEGFIHDITERIQHQQELDQYIKQIEKLNIVTAALSTTLELDEVLNLILDQINEVIPIDGCSIYLYDENNKLRTMADRGIVPSQKGLIFPEASSIFQKIKKNKQPIILENVKNEPDFIIFDQIAKIESWMGLPLIVRDTLIGFLTLDFFEENSFLNEHLQIAKSFASQAAQAIENARQLKETTILLNQIESLRIIDQSIIQSTNLDDTLDILLNQIIDQLKIDAVVILKFDKDTNKLNYLTSKGLKTNALKFSSILFGESLAGKSAKDKKHIFIPNLNDKKHVFSKSSEFHKEEFISYHCVPLISNGELIGVIELLHRSFRNDNDEWNRYLYLLAAQAAIAIEKAMLVNDLELSANNLLMAYEETIEGWASALELRDMETEGHSRRVTTLTIELAKKQGINDVMDLLNIRYGALLHDIGKIGVPDNILNKPGKLTEEEWIIMKKHPSLAYQWLSSIEYLKSASDIPYCHHEKWDGTGYPRGLKAEEIPIAARIFSVIDVWDALLSERPYRKVWTKEETIKYIQEQSGKHFDPKIVSDFLELIKGLDI